MKLIHILFFLFSFNTIYGQQIDLISRFEKQAIEIDSLKKFIKTQYDTINFYKIDKTKYYDTLKKLNNELLVFNKVNKKNIFLDSIVLQKVDSINLFKNQILDINQQINNEKILNEQKLKSEYEKGKTDISKKIINRYFNKSFDELIISSTSQSIVQELSLFQNLPEINTILFDLQRYFNAKQLLNSRFDSIQINNNLLVLGQIKRESELLTRLKKNIKNYYSFNQGLKKLISEILIIDEQISVMKLGRLVQVEKLKDILKLISSYIFNYDLNISEYPYLSEIVFELIKRKQPNPDADISDLLKNL